MKTTMRMRVARLASQLLFFVAGLPGVAADPGDARLPVPDAAARSAAVTELKKELGEKLRSKDVETKRALVNETKHPSLSQEDAVLVSWRFHS